MKAVDVRRLFAELGGDPGSVWWAMRILRERGYLAAGRGGHAGVNSAFVSSHNLAVILAALAHPRGIKFGVGDMSRLEPGALRLMVDLIEGRGAPEPVKVWHIEDEIGVLRLSVVPSDLIWRIGKAFRLTSLKAA
jgi:hypothetical protein